MGLKVCSGCKTSKPIGQFAFRKPGIPGSRCKVCVSEQSSASGAQKRAHGMSLTALRRKIHTTSNLLYLLKSELKTRMNRVRSAGRRQGIANKKRKSTDEHGTHGRG